MKATLNEIVENLVKVFTDKAESAQYYSDNEQYICLCGWCGTMSPVSRPAYYKTFGKDTTESAEAKAREIIAEKEAARKRTKYAEHAQEADRLEGVPAVGGFFWADNSGLKCDGGRGLFEELHALNYYTDAQNTPARLCCVEQIINVSEADFVRPGLADELVTRHNLQGFSRSEDVDEGDTYYNDPEKLGTFYTVGALVVSPSGKYYLIDSEGYNYARYIYVPIEWPVMLVDEVASVKAEEEARKAEEARKEAEAKAQRLAQYRARCAKWLPFMRNVEKMEQEGKATARKLDNARKANILAMCAAAFPGVKFSVSVRRGWGADFDLKWTDGPTVEEFEAKTDLSLFCRSRDTFNGWDDSTDVIFSEFCEFADLTMGRNGGDIKTSREMSDEARAALLADIFAAVPAADSRDKYGYTKPYTYTDKEAEAVAAALGVDVFDILIQGYAETADTIARRAWDKRSYTKTTTPEPTDPTRGKAQTKATEHTEAAPVQDAAQTDEAPAEGLQLVATAEGVAVIGDSRTTYRNRKAIKAHGATWNKTAQQWQASAPEAVARLREWFGVSVTPNAEEADTANESEQPGSTAPTAEQEHAHTESDRKKAFFVIFAACEIGATEWNKSGLYTGGTAEDWKDLEAVAPEAVTAWKEAGQPLNRNECARLYGEELTKEAADAHTVARHRATYCEDWRDELREIWAIYQALTATAQTSDSTAASTAATTAADATLCEAGEITATAPTDTAEDFGRLTQAGEQPEGCGKVWQFERCTDANGHELHEIRRVPSGFMVFFNVCEATGGGCSPMVVYPTYCEALEVLTHCRPGAQLIAQPAA
ncbi:LPD29 domain-containing protein [Prevotella sp.]|uniref:LPD29 domain-containing protein n=1 Tax=Prevotella sp. TaxID=59823 RepID=UPI0025FF0459|nr:LPD29 domain-containing protein [Prevotella sp.]